MNRKLRSLAAALAALLMVLSFVPAALAEGDVTEPQEVFTEVHDPETDTYTNNDVTKAYDGSIVVVNEDEEAGGQIALNVTANEYTATVEVAGDVVSTDPYGYADGLYATAYDEGNAQVHVGGDVIADGDSETWTTYLRAYADSAVDVTIDGSLAGTSADGYIRGLYGEADGGDVVIAVGGDVSMSGVGEDTDNGYAVGVFFAAYDEGSAQITVDGSVTATATGEDDRATGVYLFAYVDGAAQVDVAGDVTVSTPSEDDTAYALSANGVSGDAVITVGGDVASNEYGVYMHADQLGEDAPQGTAAVVIGGTLSGDVYPVILCEDLTEEDVESGNVALTVWRVALGEDQEHIVTQWVEDEETWDWSIQHSETAEAMEKAIRYIVKTEEQEGATLTLAGTTKDGDYDVALEGDTVSLQVSLADGFKFYGAYNGLEEKVLLAKNADGSYALVVPKCGGVIFSLDLEKMFNSAPACADGVETADGAVAYVTFYQNGTYELACGSRYDRGAYALENGEVKLTSLSGAEMTVAEDGALAYVFADGTELKLTLTEAMLSALKAA